MRRIGTLADESLARRFCDYLVTLSVDATADADGDEPGSEWNIWVRNENDVEQAKTELSAFRSSPQDGQYQVDDEAARIRDERIAEQQRRERQQRESVRSIKSTGGSGLGPLVAADVRQQSIPVTIAIIVISVIAGFTSNFSNPKTTLEQQTYNSLSFVDRDEYNASNRDSFASIRKGQVWRLVTPMFLHGDPMHLAFNMLWIFFLGSVIERLQGSLFLLLLALGTHVAGMILQVMLPYDFIIPSLRGTPFAIGASGAVYGLFGYLWIRPNLDPSYPIHLVPANVVLMLVWLVVCMIELIPNLNVANGAHLGGLFAGMFAAFVASTIRR